MVKSTLRPVFFEGQIVAATDLGGIGDHARARDERHLLYCHRPGIVTGLTLSTEDATDASGASFKRVFVEPGHAADDLGRELLVAERIELDAARFAVTIGASADATSFYPVLLKSDYRARSPATGAPGLCQATAASRIEERVDVTVGRPTDVTLADPLAPRPPNPDASPAEGGGPPLLLGFVRWDPAAGKFAEVFDRANGLGRRYAGVNAAVVAGMGNRLLLQPEAVGASGTLAVELDAAVGELRFGPLVAAGTIADPLLRVDKDGNVKAKGTLSGRAAPGTTHYASGRASDGLILPLPSGVAEDQLASGEATLQILVAPHVDPADAPAGAIFWAALTEECRVDDERRLHCRIAWMSLDFGAGPQGAALVSAPGAADYLLVASIAGGGA